MLAVEAKYPSVVTHLSSHMFYNCETEPIFTTLLLVVVKNVLFEWALQCFHISEFFVPSFWNMDLLVHEVTKQSLLLFEQIFEIPVKSELSIHHWLKMTSQPSPIFIMREGVANFSLEFMHPKSSQFIRTIWSSYSCKLNAWENISQVSNSEEVSRFRRTWLQFSLDWLIH